MKKMLTLVLIFCGLVGVCNYLYSATLLIEPKETEAVSEKILFYTFPVIEIVLPIDLNLNDYLKSESMETYYSAEEIVEILKKINPDGLNLTKGAKISLIDFNYDNEVINTQGIQMNAITLEMPAD